VSRRLLIDETVDYQLTESGELFFPCLSPGCRRTVKLLPAEYLSVPRSLSFGPRRKKCGGCRAVWTIQLAAGRHVRVFGLTQEQASS
jgi:hypothetical protein